MTTLQQLMKMDTSRLLVTHFDIAIKLLSKNRLPTVKLR